MSKARFYFDENIELAVSEQLMTGGIDVVSAHSLKKFGDNDRNHLERATAMGRVLCTYDRDFLQLAYTGASHAGIVFAPQRKASIGGWVREIRALHGRMQAEDMVGQVIFLSAR